MGLARSSTELRDAHAVPGKKRFEACPLSLPAAQHPLPLYYTLRRIALFSGNPIAIRGPAPKN
jgi:hypothetical protein